MPKLAAGTERYSDRIPQEFYCNECDGYFLANLNMHLSRRVTVICPNCDHRHSRVIKDGILCENFQAVPNEDTKEEIVCLKCTYQKEPRTKALLEAKQKSRYSGQIRNGSPLDELWLAKAAAEKGLV